MRQFCHICKKQVDLATDQENGAMKCILCGTVLFTPNYAKLDFGTIINGFLIESKIGQGGMGVVYKAKQLNLERYVALKVLAEHLASDQEFVERFFKEARAAANLNHPNIVQVYDAGSTIDGIYYFAMELIEGETLEARLIRDGLLPPKEGLEIAVKIAKALEYAWEKQKLTHGDIKPDNIIINSSGGVKLADLGLAKTAHDEKSTRDGGIMATPLYASPEIISGDFHKIGFKSDMYSFGATLYHMFAGTPPFNAEDPEVVLRMHLTDKHIPLKVKNKEINPVVSDLIEKLLAKNPDERPDSWIEVASSLEKIKDVERKVFHVSAHATEKPITEDAEHIQEEGEKIYHIVSALVALLFILFAVTGIVYFKKFRTDSTQKNDEKSKAAQKSPEDMNKEWELVKSRTATMPPQDAIALVERFMEKYHGSLPNDAASFYESLKKKALKEIADAEQKKKMIETFSSQIEQTIKELSDETNIRNKDFAELNFEFKKVETLLAMASSKELNLDIEKPKREKLNSIYLSLTQTISAARKVEEEAFKKQIEEERLKRIEQQRLQKEKVEKERADKLKANIVLDSYYLALSEDLDPTIVNSTLSEILKQSEANIPAKVRQNIEFIRSNYVSAPNALITQLCKVESILKNKPLPIPNIPPEYKVEEISEKGIKLQTYMDKVKIGKLIQWQQLSQDELRILIEKTLFSNNSYTPDPVDLTQFSSYLVQNRQFENLRSFLDKIPDKKNPKIGLWLTFLSELEYAAKENKPISKMAELRESLSRKDYETAAEKLSEMILSHSSSETYKRYQSEIAFLLSELLPFSHMIQVAQFLNNADTLVKDKHFNSALQNIYCAKSRFFNAHSSGRDEFKTFANELEKACLTSISIETNIPKIFAPFYFWEHEKAADSFAFRERFKTNPDFQRITAQNSDLLNLMETSVKLSTGDWTDVKLDSASIKSLPELRGPPSFVIPSLLFTSYLYSERAGLSELKAEVNSSFQQSAERFSKSKLGFPLTQYLFSEYLASTGQFQKAGTILSSYEYSDIANEFESRLMLLNIYCKLNLPELPPEPLHQDISAVIKSFKAYEQLTGDALWLDYSLKIIFGENLNQKQFEELSAANPKHFDISHRIMLSAIANRAKSSGMPKIANQICRIIRNKMTGMTAQSFTFRNMAYLKLAMNAYSLEAIQSEVTKILSEPLVAAIPVYPEMAILQIASYSSSGKIPREKAVQMIIERLSESTVASQLEKDYSSKMLNPADYLSFISGASAKGEINKAFSASIAFMLFSAGTDPKIINSIEAEMQNHINYLSIEQRILLSAITRLAKR